MLLIDDVRYFCWCETFWGDGFWIIQQKGLFLLEDVLNFPSLYFFHYPLLIRQNNIRQPVHHLSNLVLNRYLQQLFILDFIHEVLIVLCQASPVLILAPTSLRSTDVGARACAFRVDTDHECLVMFWASGVRLTQEILNQCMESGLLLGRGCLVRLGDGCFVLGVLHCSFL